MNELLILNFKEGKILEKWKKYSHEFLGKLKASLHKEEWINRFTEMFKCVCSY